MRRSAARRPAVVPVESTETTTPEVFGDEPVPIGQVGFRDRISVHHKIMDSIVRFDTDVARERFRVTFHLGMLHIQFRPKPGESGGGPADIYVPASNIAFMRRADR